MKNKEFTVAELQEAINGRLTVFAGRKYTGTKFHDWINGEIAAEFEARGITELTPSVWRIVTNMSEQGVSFFSDTVAEVKIERKTDKRIKYAEGRGVILSAAVSFREELLPLSLDSARRFLLEEKRQEYIKRMEGIRQKAVHEAEEAATEIARLLKLKF